MKKTSKLSYDAEADVLSLEVSKQAAIDSAREMGTTVVHFTKHNVPVLIEILEAGSFLTQAQNVLNQARGKTDTDTALAQ